jgi:hypothetical protein
MDFQFMNDEGKLLISSNELKDYLKSLDKDSKEYHITTESREHSQTAIDSVHSATTGIFSQSVTHGDRAQSITAGDGSHSITTGEKAHSMALGTWSHSVTIGNCANSTTKGTASHSVTLGDYSYSASEGEDSISAALGKNSCAKAAAGAWIGLVEYELGEIISVPINAVFAQIGNERFKDFQGNTLLPDEYYILMNNRIMPLIWLWGEDNEYPMIILSRGTHNNYELLTLKLAWDYEDRHPETLYAAGQNGIYGEIGETVEEAVELFDKKLQRS